MPSKFLIPQLLVVTTDNHRQAVIRYLQSSDPSANPEHDPRFSWLNQDGPITINQIRSLIHQLTFAVNQTLGQVVILEHWETATLPAQHAALKLLEEPPTHTQLILVTSQLGQALPTIRSRCHLVFVDPDSSWTSPTTDQRLVELYQQLPQTSHGQIITALESFSDRVEAQIALQTLLSQLHQHLELINPQILAAVATAHTQLQHNANVRLCLEHCFFALKDKV